MEKSQAKGIERRLAPFGEDGRLIDAWKNPKQRELKEVTESIFNRAGNNDAWKNPKQRELKVNTD